MASNESRRNSPVASRSSAAPITTAYVRKREEEEESDSDSGSESEEEPSGAGSSRQQALVSPRVSGFPAARMADQTVSALRDPFGINDYVESDAGVINEDQYSPQECMRIFEAFIAEHARERSAVARHQILNALAEACAKGTSAKRDLAGVILQVPVAGMHCKLSDFRPFIPSTRENALRVWCESMPEFANRTHALIKHKQVLLDAVQKASQCSYEMAPVGFDYAIAISGSVWQALSTVEKNAIYANTSRKAGPARAMFSEQESDTGGVEVHAMPNGIMPGRSGGMLPSAKPSGQRAGVSTAGMYGS